MMTQGVDWPNTTVLVTGGTGSFGKKFAEIALGEVKYEPTDAERNSLVFRRSLFVVRRVRKGERFTEQSVRPIRPGMGLLPKNIDEILGERASHDIDRGTPLDGSMVESPSRASGGSQCL